MALMSMANADMVTEDEFIDFWNIYLTMQYTVDSTPYLQGLKSAWASQDLLAVNTLDTEGMTLVLLNICGSMVEECK